MKRESKAARKCEEKGWTKEFSWGGNANTGIADLVANEA